MDFVCRDTPEAAGEKYGETRGALRSTVAGEGSWARPTFPTELTQTLGEMGRAAEPTE